MAENDQELLAVLNRVEQRYGNLEQAVARLRESVERGFGGLEQSITHLVRALADEDRRRDREDQHRDRVEQSEARERDELRSLIVDDLIQRVETIGKTLRGLPESVLQTIELQVYELRRERYLAQQSGIANEPGKLLQTHLREPSERVAVARRDVNDEITGVFDTKHTDGEKRATKELIGGVALFVWNRGGKWVATFTSGGAFLHLLQRLLHALGH